MNILIVCTGNTCRSPMAEGILKNMLSDADLAGADNIADNISVISGGLFAPEGQSASTNAVLALEEKGIDIKGHIAKNINDDVVRDADLILTMTERHKDAIKSVYGNLADGKTYTLCEYAETDGEISDPYGGDLNCYKQCADMISDTLEKVYKKIRGALL